MAKYAYVRSEFECPNCGTQFADLVGFQWGFCPGTLPGKDYIYNIGDPLRWKECSDGSILAWTYFSGKGGNIGDPAVQNLVAKDTSEWNWELVLKGCSSCHQAIGGLAVRIVNGLLEKAWIYLPGELDDEIEHYSIKADGTLQPMPEWQDHPMPIIEGC